MLRTLDKHLRALLTTLILILCATGISLTAQNDPQCIIEEFRSGEKLSYSRTSDIEQDANGFLWMGMWNGLCRYDGQEFQLFRADPNNDNPQTNNRITQIEIDSRQNIWCTTIDSRLYLFDRRTSTFSDIFSSIDSLCYIPKTRRALYALPRRGVTWVVLSDGSCLRFHDDKPTNYDCVSAQVPHTSTNLLPGVFLIADDSAGREWILADWGVQIYGGAHLTDRPFFRFHEVQQRIFLASGDGSLAEYTELRGLTEIPFPVPVSEIYMTAEVNDTQLAIATNAGLFIYDTRSGDFSQYTATDDGIPLPSIYEFYVDAKQRLWLFTSSPDFYRLDPSGSVRRFAAPAEQLNTTERYHLHLMFEDADGRVWGKARQGGLTWFDEERQQLRSYTESLVADRGDIISNYNVFFVDRQHNLWISATPSLYHLSFQRRQFNYVPNPQHNEVRAMLVDEDRNALWMGDRQGYLALRSSDGTWSYLTPDGRFTPNAEKFSQSAVYALIRDEQGTLWAGTRGGGLYHLTPTDAGTYAIENYRHSDTDPTTLSNNNIYALYEDVNGHIWVGTYGGGMNLLDHTDRGTVFYHHEHRMPGYPISDFAQVRCITGTRQGELLVGTTGGLLTFTSEFLSPSAVTFFQHFKRINDPTALPGNDVMRVLHTAADRNYVCTFGLGVSELTDRNLLCDTLHFRSHLNREYPAGDVIVTALEDHHGKLWLMADGGISRFDPADGQFTYFDRTDFDRDYRFTEATPVINARGEMTVGLLDGMLTFCTDSLRKSDYTPGIVFTGYRYPGQEPTLCNDLDDITLQAGQHSISIAFAALDFHPSELIRYAYRMERVDTTWTYISTAMVNYVNLPCGTYRLHVRSTNHDGQWCDNERILTIHVRLNLFKEPWLWGMICFLLCGGIVTVVYLRYLRAGKRLRRRRNQLRTNRKKDDDLPPLI
jgi:ligand-binding sensor domain-containing protein